MYGTMLDIALVVAVLVFAFSGYRQGFVIGALSFVGFFGGALLGVQVAPRIADRFDDDLVRLAVAVTVAFGLAMLGQGLAVFDFQFAQRHYEQFVQGRIDYQDGRGKRQMFGRYTFDNTKQFLPTDYPQFPREFLSRNQFFTGE